jgi:hypothetical protein
MWLEIATSIILAVASLVTAWNGYEATQWAGREADALGKSLAARFAATRAANSGEQQRMIDIFTFINWLEATHAGDQELADFYQARFRAEFQPVMAVWLQTEPLTNPDAPTTPFVMPDYVPAEMQRADEFDQTALAQTEAAVAASEISRDYIQNTLYVAVALFLTGLSRSFEKLKAHMLLLGASGLMLLIGIVNTLRFPIA